MIRTSNCQILIENNFLFLLSLSNFEDPEIYDDITAYFPLLKKIWWWPKSIQALN